MAIVTQDPDEIKTSETVSSYMRRFGIAKLLARCGAYKEKGISGLELFLAVFQNVFSDRSMYRRMKTGKWDHDFSKNTVYRFRNCGKIHWERFTALLSAVVANVLRPRKAGDSGEDRLRPEPLESEGLAGDHVHGHNAR